VESIPANIPMGEGYAYCDLEREQVLFIGASVSESLSSDLNVNFVSLSVCLSVCHGP